MTGATIAVASACFAVLRPRDLPATRQRMCGGATWK
jgi:hypothetical protein